MSTLARGRGRMLHFLRTIEDSHRSVPSWRRHTAADCWCGWIGLKRGGRMARGPVTLVSRAGLCIGLAPAPPTSSCAFMRKGVDVRLGCVVERLCRWHGDPFKRARRSHMRIDLGLG